MWNFLIAISRQITCTVLTSKQREPKKKGKRKKKYNLMCAISPLCGISIYKFLYFHLCIFNDLGWFSCGRFHLVFQSAVLEWNSNQNFIPLIVTAEWIFRLGPMPLYISTFCDYFSLISYLLTMLSFPWNIHDPLTALVLHVTAREMKDVQLP